MSSLAQQALRLRGLRPTRSRLLPPGHGWVCSSCQSKAALGRRLQSSASSETTRAKKAKPHYITTPIFYVNAEPHIGHLYTMVLADVLKRWEQIKGKQVFLCTGTDEHGAKIQRAAAKNGMEPKEFCDNNSAKFRQLAEAAGIANDFFIRTTDQDHKDAVAQFWLQLKHTTPEQLGLYKGVHEGWYCVSDECFYPESLVRSGIVPQTGKKITVSVETDNEVEWVREETWFFPLSKYKDALLKFYDENPDWIQPAHRMNEVREWVQNNLEDLSITRPAARLSWGIKDPEDADQTIYVWVDALINYMTKAGYGKEWTSPKEDTGIWPADLQVIGKDILRFHAIYWPALLMSLGFSPAKGVLCHNHWTMSNRKMSKSIGNVVNPFFAIQRWGVDPLRYFLMRNASLAKDMSYSNQLIGAVYTKDLQANIGNLFYRIARPKASARWSLHEAVEHHRDGRFDVFQDQGQPQSSDADAVYFTLEPVLARAPVAFREEMDAYNTGAAIRETFNLLLETNRYLADTQPWNMAKADPSQRGLLLLNWVIFNSAEALRIAGILLQPVMPTKARELLDSLAVSPERRTLAFARKGADAHYGAGTRADGPVPRTNKWETLFPPAASPEESDEELAELLRAAFEDKTRNKMNQMVEYLAMEARLGEEGVRKFLEEQYAKKARKETEGDEQMHKK